MLIVFSIVIVIIIFVAIIVFVFINSGNSSLIQPREQFKKQPKIKSQAQQKGVIGENLVKLKSQEYLNSEIYIPFHNVTIYNGEKTVQIDHIFLSIYGIFILETKHYSGWIYGNPYHKTWTQTFQNNKRQFQNPIHQNYGHIKFLENFLTIEFEKFHSVIVFSGESELKTSFPKNVCTLDNFCHYILSFTQPIFNQKEIESLATFLKNRTLPTTEHALNFHINHIEHK